MSIETKAKTTREIINSPHVYLGSPYNFDSKWVPLEDARKEIAKKENVIASLKKMVEVQSQIKREAVDAAISLEAKIEAAKQTVDDMKQCCFQDQGANEIYQATIGRLEAILFPRKENQTEAKTE